MVAQIQTYLDLQSAVSDYLLQRTDLSEQIQLFIQLAEAGFNRTLRHPQMELRVDFSTVAGQPAYELPSDFLEMNEIIVFLDGTTSRALPFHSSNSLEHLFPFTLDNDQPRAYTLFGNQLRLGPTPQGAYAMVMAYMQQIPPLATAQTGTNWLLQAAPDLYLYGSLIRAHAFLVDPDQLGMIRQEYQAVLTDFQLQADRQRFNGPPLACTVDFYTP